MRVAFPSQGTDVIYHRVRVTRVADQQDNAEATLPAQGRAEVHEPSASQRQKAESFVALNLRPPGSSRRWPDASRKRSVT